MSCGYQMGMLVLRECGSPATSACSLCGTPVCSAHTLMGSQGPACPQCASQSDGYEDTDDTEIAEARGQYFTQYGGASQFGSRGYFSGNDAAAMASRNVLQNPLQPQRYDPKET